MSFLRFQLPWVISLAVPIIILLFVLLRLELVKFKDKEAKQRWMESKPQRRKMQLFLWVSRSLVVLLILLAIASPYALKQITTAGDQSVVILADKSRSFELFDAEIAPKLQGELEKYFPVDLKYVAIDETSAIGDGVLGAIRGNDNIILVSDGNTNVGRNLADIITYASSVNSTVNAVTLKPQKTDLSVEISGPRRTVSDVDNNFVVLVDNPSSVEYKLVVTVDGKEVINTMTKETSHSFTKAFVQGVHKIVARIETNDLFKENNVYYKSVEVLEKPNVLFVSMKESPLLKILKELYKVTVVSSIPENLDPFSTIILNDIPGFTTPEVEKLSSYVIDGNGLVVIGGDRSYNFGNYENEFIETLLPTVVGTGGRKEGEINVILVIDISGSTGKRLTDAGSKKVDVEKAQTLSLLSDFRPDDTVGVVAFNVNAFTISEPVLLSESQDELVDRILMLQDGGGTVISAGIKRAMEMLADRPGSNNIVVISDGKTKHQRETFDIAAEAAEYGMRVYTVGIGKDTHRKNMEEIARLGRGAYFEPSQAQRLRIMFGRPPETAEGVPSDRYALVLMDEGHFITKNLDINATISGFNQVVPKSSAQLLASTHNGFPVLVTWRFGLGRVVTVATDDGTRYAGELLSPKKSEILSRSINWAIGDLNRRAPSYVDISDTHIDKPVDVVVKKSTKPETELIELSKIDEDIYSGVFTPTATGFVDILGTTIGVNYNTEFRDVGLNPELEETVVSTGGKMLNPEDIKEIVEHIKITSKRIKTENVFYRWPFLMAALIIFLIEVCLRRIIENRNLFK
ncbi:VWA domain-containing protein [Candidatus Woesearchaeota archaeon]|nr:VWA domain-containing protein [Candidatus Woesearchaeota archaeon]